MVEDDISKKEAPKEKPVDYRSPLKVTTSVLKAPSTSKSSKGKKSSREGSRTPNGAAVKKVKIKHVRFVWYNHIHILNFAL